MTMLKTKFFLPTNNFQDKHHLQSGHYFLEQISPLLNLTILSILFLFLSKEKKSVIEELSSLVSKTDSGMLKRGIIKELRPIE